MKHTKMDMIIFVNGTTAQMYATYLHSKYVPNTRTKNIPVHVTIPSIQKIKSIKMHLENDSFNESYYLPMPSKFLSPMLHWKIQFIKIYHYKTVNR